MNEFKLDTHPRIDTGFKAPEDYFAALSEKITAQLEVEAPEPKVISLYKRHKKTIYAVAAVLVLALSVPFFMKTSPKITEVDGVAFEEYVSYNTRITPYELAEYLDEEDIKSLTVEYKIPDDVLEESLINTIEIEHYSTY